jgi:outer membrane protein assembly factor BamB
MLCLAKVRAGVLLLLLLPAYPAMTSETNSEPPPWPCFHGPNYDNISLETGLLKEWPDKGPALVWHYSECGDGYSTVSFAEDRIFTAGHFGDSEMVLALSMDGELLWKTRNGNAWTGSTPGSRTVPTYCDGLLYQMNPTGLVSAIRASTGETVWSVELSERFGTGYDIWGLSENLVVDDERVLCMPGGERGRIVALDKRSGETLWANTEVDEIAAYCTPLVTTHEGVRQYITLTGSRVVSVDVGTGKLLWSHPHETPYNQSITTPIYSEGHVFITSGHSGGGRLLKLAPGGRSASEVWYREDLDSCHGGVFLLDGSLFGSSCRVGGKIFFRADFMTGALQQSDLTVGKLALTYAEGALYGMEHGGEVKLIALKPTGFEVVSRFRLPREGKGKYLAHPVVYGKRLYLRHWNHLYVYDVAAKQSGQPAIE